MHCHLGGKKIAEHKKKNTTKHNTKNSKIVRGKCGEENTFFFSSEYQLDECSCQTSSESVVWRPFFSLFFFENFFYHSSSENGAWYGPGSSKKNGVGGA